MGWRFTYKLPCSPSFPFLAQTVYYYFEKLYSISTVWLLPSGCGLYSSRSKHASNVQPALIFLNSILNVTVFLDCWTEVGGNNCTLTNSLCHPCIYIVYIWVFNPNSAFIILWWTDLLFVTLSFISLSGSLWGGLESPAIVLSTVIIEKLVCLAVRVISYMLLWQPWCECMFRVSFFCIEYSLSFPFRIWGIRGFWSLLGVVVVWLTVCSVHSEWSVVREHEWLQCRSDSQDKFPRFWSGVCVCVCVCVCVMCDLSGFKILY